MNSEEASCKAAFRSRDEEWMREALAWAQRALERGEVPVGAVVACRDVLLGAGHNCREARRDPLAHAELLALRRAARRLGGWRLGQVTLYVTLEPCPMCAGAMLQARVGRLVYGARNFREGAAGTCLNLVDYPGLEHRVEVRAGVLEVEARRLLKEFFRNRRAGEAYGEVAEPG